ncbi:MAG: hypothetical protein DHS20C15_08400 [Planctomycetota bacterium]|nr:MAG: hypothetical protein DHS20C15_08400 [Planctomycetota bacterium]
MCVLVGACGDDTKPTPIDDTPAPPSVAPADAPELLIVTIDTWRFDHTDWSGLHPAELTPHMAALAERGVIFERAYSPMNQTLPAHATLFTGLSPREHGALENQYRLHERFDTLAESLTQAGWNTAAFIGAGVLHESTGIAQGFSHWDLPPASELEQLGIPERPASAVSAAARDWWAAQGDGRPRFAWAHFYDPHAYYRPPDDALAQVPRAATDALIAERAPRLEVSVSDLVLANAWHDYAGEVRATDAQVGALIDTVLSGERGANTFVVVLSDHGEGLYEHGEASHELTLFENQMRVPLFVFGPGVRAGERVATPVELADVRPTLERLVLRREPTRSAGRDLSPALTGGAALGQRPIFLERPHLAPERVRARSRSFLNGSIEGGVLAGVVNGTDKLLREPSGTLRLFDLLEDPGELEDLSSREPERRRELERLLEAWITRRPTPELGSGASADEEHLARLRALGYIK